jgi:Ca-activated chloride channel homolog
MTFAYPWLLLLYLPYLVLLFYLRRRPAPAVVVASVQPFAAATSRKKSLGLPFILFTLAAGLLIFALARPRLGSEKIVLRADGIDIMLALDLSGSMKCYDVPKNITTHKQLRNAVENKELKNRLEVAKEEIRKFIIQRPNDRIGLVGFANMAYNASPPTLDHGWLLANLERLQPGIIGDGTGIASPIASAVHRLEKSDSKRRVLVLFTDGSNNVNARISPRQAAKFAKTCDVAIYTVGIGSDNAFSLQNTFAGPQFRQISGQFDESLLHDIATFSDGKYYRAYDQDGLEKAMNDINKLEKTSVEQPKYIEYKEFAPTIIALALAVLVIGFMLDNSLYLKLP